MSDDSNNSGATESSAIVPTSITLNAAPASFSKEANQGSVFHKNRWTLLGLVATGLLALVVVFVLPKHVAEKKPQSGLTQQIDETTPTVTTPEKLNESPWQDAQLAKARRETQDLLAEMLDRQKELENKRVMQWGAEEFTAAQQIAADADGFYREQNFIAARQNYQNALNLFEELLNKSSAVFETAMSVGETALQAGDPGIAVEKFTLAVGLDPNNSAATAGLERAQALPQLLTHLEEGKRAQRDGNLDNADTQFSAALAIDPLSNIAKEKSNEVKIAIRERDFAQQMSAGFAAMHNNDMPQAMAAFKRALRIKPGAADAQAALTQADNQHAEYSLQQWLQKAEQQEANEEWEEAVASYDKALTLDGNLVAARVGKIRSTARANIDKQMVEILASQERLATPQVHQQFEIFYQDTQKLQSPGAKLTTQLTQLRRALDNAVKSIEVTLRSDNLTTVRLNRVADLGKFSETTVTLKPGTYTAVGTRSGFRDVRLDFTVPASNQGASVIVECTEKINNG